jgi:hypothetical protein
MGRSFSSPTPSKRIAEENNRGKDELKLGI